MQLKLLLQVLMCHQFFLSWDVQDREQFVDKRNDVVAKSPF